MSAAPQLRAVAPRGYVSEESKRRFQVTAGVLGGLFAVGQFVVPMAVSMAMMPMMFFPSFTTMQMASPGRPLLQELPIEGDAEPVEHAELPVPQPWLLPGGEGLWVITPDYVGLLPRRRARGRGRRRDPLRDRAAPASRSPRRRSWAERQEIPARRLASRAGPTREQRGAARRESAARRLRVLRDGGNGGGGGCDPRPRETLGWREQQS